MSVDPELGPEPAVLRDLLAAERRVPEASAATRARVWAGVVGKLPPPGGGGGGDPSGDGGAGHGDPDPGEVPSGGGGASAARPAAIGAKAALPWLAGVLALGVGVAIVAVVARSSSPAPDPLPPPAAPRIAAPIAPPIAPSSSAPPLPTLPNAGPSQAPASRVVRQRAASIGDAASPSEDVLIERARMSLARARFDEALALLTEHEQRFAAGVLRGERELLIVRALIGTNRRADAEARAAGLRRSDPDNPQLRAIDAVLAR
jgi:hypothetical protein